MGPEEEIYEMLWDCKYCGQKKLLGITHRFCAGCGAPQDPAARYFPSEEDKVAVKGHPYVGADVVCPACRQPMARAAKCCTNCGGPLQQGAEAAKKADVVVPPPGFGPPPAAAAPNTGSKPSSSSNAVLAVVGALFGLVAIVVLVAAFWKREGILTVSGHSWQRSIAIERFEAGRKSVWCDEAPGGSRELSRRREQKSTTKEKDGEVCGTRKQDLGNGSYKQVKECTPKYKDVPVMADKCDIEVVEWHASRTLTEKGESLADAPRWPLARVSGGTCLGCEREGTRSETYTVTFTDEKSGKTATCTPPLTRWSTLTKGSRWKGKLGVMTSSVDCDTLSRL